MAAESCSSCRCSNGAAMHAWRVLCWAFSRYSARVTQMSLGAPTFPYGNATFGNVGQYEQLDGFARERSIPRILGTR